MSQNTVPSGSTATLHIVEGDLKVGKNALVRGSGTPPIVTVSGSVQCQGDCLFECSLVAQNLLADGYVVVKGDLEVKERVKIGNGIGFGWVHGKAMLNVEGKMTARTVDIDNRLSVGKDFEAETVDVGGRLEVKGKTAAQLIDVGGSFSATGEVEAQTIDVGGSVRIESKVKVEKLDVGGSARIGGGRVNTVDVGGSFESGDSLEFNSIDVGGVVRLAGKNVGGDIDVGGSCKVQGDLQFGNIDVGGVVEISGSAQGDDLDVGGKVRVDGDMKLSRNLDVGGMAAVGGELTAQNIDVGGRLSGKKITAAAKVSVEGSIDTIEGVHASYVEIGEDGEVRGPIKSVEAVISEGARVEDVHAKTITLESEATARNLYGERIRLESDCHIYGEVLYTERLETGEGVTSAKRLQKVDKLPSACSSEN